MFDAFPKALASVASFLFPLFASYKALNSADPAQLTPWLMYWVVLSCLVFVESWVDWLLVWVPFYHYFRLFFILYLVLPQTQGARILYQTHLHPWLARHEARIDEFIGSAHDRMRSAGMHYLKQALSYLRAALGLPGLEAESQSAAQHAAAASSAATTPQGYSQALLARFSLPSARWPGGAAGAAASGGSGSGSGNPADLYNLLASAVGALGTATGAAGGAAAGVAASAFSSRGARAAATSASSQTAAEGSMSASDRASPRDRASMLASARDRLRTLLSALDDEVAQAAQAAQRGGEPGEPDGEGLTSPLSRPPSGDSGGSGGSGGLSKSRSEPDFEKIDAESGTEEERPGAGVRQRRPNAAPTAATAKLDAAASATGRGAPGTQGRTASGSWMPWAWGSSAGGDGGIDVHPKEEGQ